MQRRSFIRRLGLISTGAWLTAARGQSAPYPNHPVRIVVGFPPGGATDVVARVLAPGLIAAWGQPVLVDNRPGAGGNLAADAVAKAAPDGYTLLMTSPAEVAINPYLYSKLPFDPARDLAAICKVATAPLVLVVHPSVAADSVAALIALAKAKPGALSYASSGNGGPQHLAGEWFKQMAGIDMTHIPYKGGAPAIADLLGGQVQLFFAGVPPALPHIQSGRLRAIAVTSPTRSPLVPNLPTIDESGLRGFAIENWQGLLAPAGTPGPIIEAVQQQIAATLGQAESDASLQQKGAQAAVGTAAQFEQFIRSESDKYAQLVKLAGARID